MNSQDYAVVVGIKDYPGFRPLKGPEKDAKRVYDWLVDPKGGGLKSENCKKVDSSAEGPEPVPLQTLIDRQFKEIWDQLRINGGSARRLYFYFSGHGVGVQEANTALLLANFSESFYRDSALSSAGYSDRLISSGKFEEVVFWLDCCRTPMLGVTGLNPTFSWPRANEAAGATSYFIAYASEYQTYAYEAEAIDPDVEQSPIYKGHFTEALINGLSGEAAEAASGRITPESLKKYLERETPRIALKSNHLQKARVTNNFDSNRQSYFGDTFLTEICYEISFSKDRKGMVLLFNGAADMITSWQVTNKPFKVTLKPDKYFLLHMATQEKKEIHVRPGSTHDKILF
jgi:hypothetical protein